ncbi:MAG TPA: universal stress protein, partial [Silvibacterium sp.]|nr:universal stress protein [Silvibacterium sp.]
MSDPFANHDSYRTFAAPDKILLATNLDDTGYLVPHAIAQARASGATLTLAHVTPPAEYIPLDASAILSADAAVME